MENLPIPTIEELFENVVADKNTSIEQAKEFTRLHVQAAIEEIHTLQKLKYYAGETGYLKKEDIINAYPLTNIK